MSSDDKILKKLAVDSIALMAVAAVLSSFFTYQNTEMIYAGGRKAAITNTPEMKQLAGTEYNDVYMDNIVTKIEAALSESKKFKEELGDRYIKIAKPDKKNVTLKVQDIYMERILRIYMEGVKDSSVDVEEIQRINCESIFSGMPLESGVVGLTAEEAILYQDNKQKEKLQRQHNKTENKDGDYVKNINIQYKKDKSDYMAQIDLTLDNIYVPSIYEDKDNFYISLKKPGTVYDKVIVIDAGHGGNDIGTFTKYGDIYEKNFNLDIVLELKKLLEHDNIKVYYTRLSDQKVYLNPRVDLANDSEADFFISVHCNASSSSQANGTEILYAGEDKTVRSQSKKFAQICMDEVVKSAKTKKRGIVLRKDVYILENAKVPAALIEGAYLTNPGDLNFLQKKKNRKKIAEGIYHAIIKAFEGKDQKK